MTLIVSWIYPSKSNLAVLSPQLLHLGSENVVLFAGLDVVLLLVSLVRNAIPFAVLVRGLTWLAVVAVRTR